jgi:hypothetical protein
MKKSTAAQGKKVNAMRERTGVTRDAARSVRGRRTK